MRQHKSVFMMLTRSSIYKVCGLLALMVIVEGLLFWRMLERVVLAVSNGGTTGYSLESVIDGSRIEWIFGLFFVLITIVLCYIGCEHGSRQGYTLRRLSITEKEVFWCQAFYNICCYFLLWAVQILSVAIFCLLYMKEMDTAFTSNQTIFLAFYRNDFLHGLLPLEEINVWVRNLILLLGLGAASACFPYKQRRKKQSAEIIGLGSLALFCFCQPIGLFVVDYILICCSAAIIIACVLYVYWEEVPDEN